MGIGDYYGICDEKMLNEVYNAVDFVFCLGKYEGLQLPMYESIVSGHCIPIVANDMTVVNEIFDKNEWFLVNPNYNDIADFINSFQNEEEIRKYAETIRNRYINFIDNNLSPISVATKIINVYNSL